MEGPDEHQEILSSSDEPATRSSQEISAKIRDVEYQMKQQTDRLQGYLSEVLKSRTGNGHLLFIRELVRLINKSYNQIYELKLEREKILASAGPLDETLV